MAQESIRTEFLKLFAQEIIKNLAVEKYKLERIKEKIKIYKGIVPEEQLIPKEILPWQLQKLKESGGELIGVPAKSMIKEIGGILPFSKITPKKTFPLKPISTNLKKRQAFLAFKKNFQMPPKPFSHQPSLIPSIASPKLRSSIIQKLNIIAMAKIENLLYDPLVQTLECPGPAKQVLVYKSGVIQTTNISLVNEEINQIMKEISEKTRIPLMPGIFKAALGDFIVTAVISDFVGTRFMITKKPSVQAQMPQ